MYQFIKQFFKSLSTWQQIILIISALFLLQKTINTVIYFYFYFLEIGIISPMFEIKNMNNWYAYLAIIGYVSIFLSFCSLHIQYWKLLYTAKGFKKRFCYRSIEIKRYYLDKRLNKHTLEDSFIFFVYYPWLEVYWAVRETLKSCTILIFFILPIYVRATENCFSESKELTQILFAVGPPATDEAWMLALIGVVICILGLVFVCEIAEKEDQRMAKFAFKVLEEKNFAPSVDIIYNINDFYEIRYDKKGKYCYTFKWRNDFD